MKISCPLQTLLAVVVCLSLPSAPALAEKRVALVIGNGAYRNATPLPNPPNDARDVAAALTRTGFETIVGIDLDRAGMDKASVSFTRAARDADVAIFYYSGHALQFAGINYLMPVDAQLTDEADLRLMSRVDDVVTDLQQAKNLRILVLDACRDNPFAEALKRSIGRTRSASLGNGLAKIDSPQGMIVAYATQAGHTAEDGSGRNSPYTSAFLKHIETAEEIGTVFRRISADVYDTTQRTQLPELSLSLIGEFYLKGRSSAALPASAKPEEVSALEQRLKTLEDQLKAREEQKTAPVSPQPQMAMTASPLVAGALSYASILGKWCGIKGNPNLTNYLFTRDKLTVTHLSTGKTTVLELDRYDFSDATVAVHYFAKSGTSGGTPGNKKVQVIFGEFGPDGKTMVQVKTSGSEAYRFVRC
jgi:hypothetical protein